MRLPAPNRRGGLRFNLTPLIDIVFNLIIFFLAASHLARSESREAIELPEAGTGRPESPEAVQRLTVTVLADGRWLVGKEHVTPAGLDDMLREASAHPGRPLEVRVRTDRRVPYGRIEPLLLACAKAGATRVKFAVTPVTTRLDH